MKPIYIDSVGVLGPGLVGWEQTRAVLAGTTPYVAAPIPALKPTRLAPDVRRRTTDHIRLAVEIATEATNPLGEAAALLPSVFASAESDGAIAHDICQEVAKPQPQVSPTRFHNSVNNAPAGYWCQAIRSQAPSTSIAGYDGSFAMGILEAALQLLTEAPRILLVAHDTPMPEPLNSARPMTAMFGVALVMSREGSAQSLARVNVTIAQEQNETALENVELEHLRRGNPAARALPLLAALELKKRTDVVLPYVRGRSLAVNVESPI